MGGDYILPHITPWFYGWNVLIMGLADNLILNKILWEWFQDHLIEVIIGFPEV